MSTPGTASSSDARKRKAEKDESNWQPIELTDGERKFLAESTATLESKVERIIGLRLAGKESVLDPPPVPAAPWSVISTDRDKPTLAKVTWNSGNLVETRRLFRDGDDLFDGDSEFHVGPVKNVTHVELLHAYSPESHVLVERARAEQMDALVDEAARWRDHDRDAGEGRRSGYEILLSLAALADGDEKGAES